MTHDLQLSLWRFLSNAAQVLQAGGKRLKGDADMHFSQLMV